jgi:PIN domain nuclease of toxin-antitoxin system
VNRYVTDTHALFWYRTASPRLSATAKAVFDDAAKGQSIILIPAIVLAELFYVNEKLGRPLDFVAEFDVLRAAAQFELLPFEATDVLEFGRAPGIPEMHDRMIAVAALRHDATLITRDAEIIGSGLLKVIW